MLVVKNMNNYLKRQLQTIFRHISNRKLKESQLFLRASSKEKGQISFTSLDEFYKKVVDDTEDLTAPATEHNEKPAASRDALPFRSPGCKIACTCVDMHAHWSHWYVISVCMLMIVNIVFLFALKIHSAGCALSHAGRCTAWTEDNVSGSVPILLF